MHNLSLLPALLLYLAASIALFCSIHLARPRLRRLSVGMAVAGFLLHGWGYWQHGQQFGLPDVSVLSLLSLCALVVVFLLCISELSRNSLFEAGLIALPLAAVVLLLELTVPQQELLLRSSTGGTALHVISSVLAFGFLTIAAVYALFAASIDHLLRNHNVSPMVQALPPLELLEALLFRLILAGFVLLTISLISGLFFIDNLFAQHLVHKTTLTIIAWILFGVLLWGRWRFGWRGRKAVRLCLAGVIVLLIGYFGSKWVLEVVLHESWRSG